MHRGYPKRKLPLWEMAGMVKRVITPSADPPGWVTLPGPRFYISPTRSPPVRPSTSNQLSLSTETTESATSTSVLIARFKSTS